MKASPAPVVSTASTGSASTSAVIRPCSAISAPAAPRVTTTSGTRRLSSAAARATPAGSGSPASSRASSSFGSSTSAPATASRKRCGPRPARNPAEAGSTLTCTPRVRAARSATMASSRLLSAKNR